MPDSEDFELTPREPEMPEDALGLGLAEPAKPAPAAPAPVEADPAYRVLARKYRPQSFDALIGQDAMVQTLANAIKRDRLAHAFLMTGVRGVGKTSTARLIAKALNCIGPDGEGGPTIHPCGVCEPCRAIAEGRHIDVIEMDAASHTGVDDVREIIEAVRYAAVSARYKIYIIDEVHMLSKNAFNALLKTLEEPPAHVKFLFATTEVQKVPVTVLSRCQRFDLKRIPADLLARHFAQIATMEGAQAEPEAITLVAHAAEGSVRDGLSILDQAIAHADMEGDGTVTAAQVRDMLGLSDRGAIRRLLGLLLGGDVPAMLAAVKEQHSLGVEPLAILSGLLSEIHSVTLTKAGGAPDPALSDEARAALSGWAEKLSFPVLHRLWQLLLKGHDEVRGAAMPMQACEMALLRIMHAATLPDPGELARMIAQGGADQPTAVSASAPEGPPADAPAAAASVIPSDFASLIDLVETERPLVAAIMSDAMRLVRYAPPELIYQAAGRLPSGFENDVRDVLYKLTGERWTVEEGEGEAQLTAREVEEKRAEEERAALLASPLVKAALEAFPDARILEDGADSDPQQRSASA
ncbi:DNA polymerase III subunit gamma/tau [Novosphingopyxis iocasae]|uniref:DNA polymerase III subunit gamma/tau n=1 Tax=Novosphingopyxis iocasae TaxID=2762729 RepID=UPI0016513B8B|nr:DNA polymerase III subunit gamma/tau [Novosphingopyxis iocasae]